MLLNAVIPQKGQTQNKGALCVIDLLCGYIRALLVKGGFKTACLQLAEAMSFLSVIRQVSVSNISQVFTKVADIFRDPIETWRSTGYLETY